MIKGILMDYGGTIDTNGLHWAVVLKNSYARAGISIPDDVFKNAYAFGERSLAITPLVNPEHNFLDVLRIKTQQQFSFLLGQGYSIDHAKAEEIAQDCNRFAQETVQSAVPVLDVLAGHYPLIMVSNFYGNLQTVLENFGIRKYFLQVVESARVGVRKPDPAIYQKGVELLKLLPAECAVVGDSFSKDIVPGKKTGCFTVWLNAKGWEEDAPTGEYTSDKEITDLAQLPNVLNGLLY